ncbi:MAG: Lipid A export ATP-binding/permease protein MsbA [uncultured Phycisphaerae bacterium]|uniref:Lipid A export ATP-binding/permease protein MsbA n=1 Tax=uncultured Phycisphaerae bacterium TaxID=904963 RepID=A0A6J4PRS5_9BACT|nr:MAG: Lipid A export ATP-binding/permease protein MsbA [uncultured Phycisphaerae bacterium]
MSNKQAVAPAATGPTPARSAEATAALLPAPGVQPSKGDAPAVALPPHEAATNRELLLWMFGFLRPVRGLVVMACVYLSLWVLAEVMTVRQTAEAVNHIQRLHYVAGAEREPFWSWTWGGAPEAALLRGILFGLLLWTGAMLVLRYLRSVAETKLSMTMVYYIREAVYDKLQRVGFGFHDAVSSGQLINRALSDLQNVRLFNQTAVLSTLEIVLSVGGYIALLATRSPWLALLSLVPLPIWTWYILRFGKRVQPVAKAAMEADDKMVSVLTENIAGVHVVKAFATESHEIDKYGKAADSFFERVRDRIRLFADFQPVIRMIAVASHLSLFLLLGVLIVRAKGTAGALSAGEFLALGAAMGAILGRLQAVATIAEQYQNAIVSSRRLFEVLAANPTVPEAPAAPHLPHGPGAVGFEGVSFGYDRAKPVLHDVTFAVPGGARVAVVGPTGAGKTTLVNLVARFYDPQEGRITIDGADVRDVSLASLRTQVSFVFQETYLFSDTVAGNIAYGRPNISRGEVEAAARLAQAHEFIEHLPQGYDTMLGERGASLSGGQRQRLAIARAILTNPRVLVLDDATASVDPETEDLIRRAMRFVMHGRTTFVIAHRISTVKQADVVVVLERGRVTQTGTHAELMAADGHYREIAAVQLHGDDLARDAEGHAASHMDRVQDPRVVAADVAEMGRGGAE